MSKAEEWVREHGYRWGGRTATWPPQPPKEAKMPLQQVSPYFTHLSQTLLTMQDQREIAHKQILDALEGKYIATLQALKAVQDGDLDIKELIISDDGWTRMPAEDD